MRSQQLPTVREGLPRVPSSREVCWRDTEAEGLRTQPEANKRYWLTLREEVSGSATIETDLLVN